MTNDPEPTLIPESEVVDFLVVGAGGGLAGAIRAAQLGLSVVVVDRSEHFATGNNTSMSTAMIPGAGSRWQRQENLDDSPERFLRDVQIKTKDTANKKVALALTAVSARLVEWLADYVELDLSLVTDFDYPGHSVWRCHTVPDRSGRTLLSGLIAAARKEPNIEFLVPAKLVEIEINPQGFYSVSVETPNGMERIVAKGLLLAANGFGANKKLVSQHIPQIADAHYYGGEGSTGDAISLATKLGAAVEQLDAYQGHAALAMPAATLVGWATVMHGGFLVDASGNRFGDESVGYSEYAETVLKEAGGKAWLVIDKRVNDACMSFKDYKDTVESGTIRWAHDAKELAEKIGIDPDGLVNTVQETRKVASGEIADRFGRTHWEAPLGGELGAVAVSPALFHTQGGLSVNDHAQVLNSIGNPIEGLYASGGSAVGMSGAGASGYIAGNGLLSALGLAFLAAENFAERVN